MASAIRSKILYSLVKHGPDQGNEMNFNELDNSGRKLLNVKQINGETVKRK